MEKSIRKDYFVTASVLIFVTLMSIIVITRLIIIKIAKTNTFEDISLLSEVSTNEDNNISQTVLKVKNTMEKYYGIEIYYGDILKDILPMVNASAVTTDNVALDILLELNDELSKYPDSLIGEIESAGYVLSVYLVDGFNDGNIAIANRTSNGYFNIFVSNHKYLETAFHHEFYHILEFYMKLEYDLESLYAEWESLNPEDFSYVYDTNISAKYVYGLDGVNDWYFVTLYSKYSPEEDRAEVFSKMVKGKEKYSLSAASGNILLKEKYITDVLKKCFVSMQDFEYLYE